MAFAAIQGMTPTEVQPAAASELVAPSEIPGFTLVPLRAVPHSPEDGALDEYCEQYRAETLSDLGHLIQKQGWIVTSEATLGRYRVVSFASGFEPGTSALCFARNANIAIFDGQQLLAIAYAAHGKDRPLGKVEPLESGALLIWSDPPGMPVGELHADGGKLRLTKLSPQRSFCHGKASVPNVYGKSIAAARRILMASGWRPRRPDEKPGEGDMARTLARQGLIEAEICSGTGVGYCGFGYQGKVGQLEVTTVGGEPDPAANTVVNYEVICPKGNERATVGQPRQMRDSIG